MLNIERRTGLLVKLAASVTPKQLAALKRLLSKPAGHASKVMADAGNAGERFGSKGKAAISALFGPLGAGLSARKGRGWAAAGRSLGGGVLGLPLPIIGQPIGAYLGTKGVGSLDQITQLKAMRKLYKGGRKSDKAMTKAMTRSGDRSAKARGKGMSVEKKARYKQLMQQLKSEM